MKRNCIALCMLSMLLLFETSCGSSGMEKNEISNVKLFTVRRADMASAQYFPGRVMASEEVNMAFKVNGTLLQVYVNDGSKIRKGQLLAEIDPRDYQVQKDAAEAEYMSIKSEAERVMALYADSVSTADAYDKARFGLKQVTAKYENAVNQLADTKIYAPFDGFVQRRLLDPPTVIAAGMPVMTIISDGNLEIEINIPASTYLRHSDIVSFSTSFDFIPERNVNLGLKSIAHQANANQLYTVKLAVPEGLTSLPSPGMNAMVNIEFKDEGYMKTLIPSSALIYKNGESFVWIYDEKKGIIVQRAVSVERLDTEGNAIVTQGIFVGERIVCLGVHKLINGQRVKPLASETETNVGGLL